MDKKIILDQPITVAISAPPPHQSNQSKSVQSILTSFGASRRPLPTNSASSRGEMKPRMSFIPQSVRKNLESNSQQLTSIVPPSSGGDSNVSIKKTNEDFRNLLLNKK